VVGANGYLGSAICNAFLRAHQQPFRVYGLVRRAAAARALAAAEVIPIVGSLSDDRDTLPATILSRHSRAWDVIVTCTEPAHSADDPASTARHWDDVLHLVRTLASASAAEGVRPLVLWSSGCKDYGMTGLHGVTPNLAPHTEDSPVGDVHPLIRGRTEAALRALDEAGRPGGADCDVAVVRATPVFGYSGSYYGAGFDYAAAFGAAVGDVKDPILKFTAHKGTVIHGVHVDDCAEGYVALATTALFGSSEGHDRIAVAGQIFNISGRRYETLEEVGRALAEEYGFTGGTEFGVTPEALPEAVAGRNVDLLFGWSQWVASDKIRRVTGWTDRRPLFSENLHVYRLAYDAAVEAGSEDVGKVRKRMGGNWSEE
jgi:nucleoside-diphosphate-sugar epimerase